MIRGLLLCTAICAAPMPVMAGERDLPIIPDLRALLAADGAPRMPPGRKLTPLRRVTYLPIAYRGLERDGIRSFPARPMQIEPVKLHSSFALEQLRALPSWRLAEDPASDATSVRGGSWAVRDTLADYRKPRIRRSPLSTMLVLRIDGEEASPPISVGGGGVAAVLWKAVPGT